MPDSSPHLPDEQARRDKALVNAGKRIRKLLIGYEGVHDASVESEHFTSRSFDWVSEAEFTPTRIRNSKNHTLGEIFEDIILDVNVDELGQYAREQSGGDYFKKAWKNAEAFRKTQSYFKTAEAENSTDPASYIYDKTENPTYYLAMPKMDIPRNIELIKAHIAEFEHHLGAYRDALDYRLKAVSTARSVIQAVMSAKKGAAFSEIDASQEPDFNEYLKQCLTGAKQHGLAADTLEQLLEQADFNHPLLRDHIRAATSDAFTPQGFSPKIMDRYFKALEESTETKIRSCGDIIKYCADTRTHMDRIVTQEMQKQGLGK